MILCHEQFEINEAKLEQNLFRKNVNKAALKCF
jgi:hypothetical protein